MSNLKVFRLVVILLAVFTFVAGEEGWIANGLLADEAGRGAAFYLNMAVILLTIISVPLAYHFRQRGSKLLVPLILLSVTALVGIVAYYLTWSNTGLLCAAIVLIMLFYVTRVRKNL